ncbi:hypothetical protein [Sulfurimonas sp. HSL3-2]|uniref:hypothetical protein n=1 Tax=Hydrocurvibacter mobilis TaxID=3131936 RepID=UPI0031F9D063
MRVLFLIFIFSMTLTASEYAVITSSKSTISELSSKQVKDIFMMKLHYIDDVKVIPINASASAAIRQEFEKNVLKTDRQRLNNYWIKQHFQGISPPVTQPSIQSVKMFIKNVNGTIGYIPMDMVDPDVRVLYEF